MKIKHIATGLALLAMPFTAQAEVREAGLVDGFGMSLIYPAVHTKNIAAENAINKDITGDLLDKSKFGVKVDSAEVVNLLKEGKLDLYNINGKKLSYDSFFKPTAYMEAECFLLGKKELGLLYAAGELAPYSEGATYVVIHLK